jgi:7-cyano-7-deazaguanine synthase
MAEAIAVLASGGLDSCVLLADMAQHATVYPLYIRHGLIWESEEFGALQAFIEALHNDHIKPVTELSLPVQPLYGNHWSVSGVGIPTKHDPEHSAYIPGRNVLLLSVAAVWCCQHDVHRIALGTLSTNPFPDATLDFFQQLGKTLSTALAFPITIEAPYRKKDRKEDLVRKFPTLRLDMSLSCMAPKGGVHCGQCNKCHERKVGYQAAGILDTTQYLLEP